MAKSIKKYLKSFTLIELIIVIAIIAVLGASAFLVLSQWMSKGRDAQRIGDLATIKTALDIALAKSDELPLPDEANELLYSGTKILYQGLFGDDVVKQIGTLNKVPKDKLQGEYEFSLLYDKKTYRVRAEIENEIYKMSYLNYTIANNNFYRYIGKDLKAVVVKDMFVYLPSMFITGYVNNEFDLYSGGFNMFVGEKAGEFKSGFALPINETTQIKSELGDLGFEEVEINNIINQGIVNMPPSLELIVKSEGNANIGFIFFQNGVQIYPNSCNDLIVSEMPTFKVVGPWNGTKFENGFYWIKPDKNPAFKVYCDMTSSGGGWAKISTYIENNEERKTIAQFLNDNTELTFDINYCQECTTFPGYMMGTHVDTGKYYCFYKFYKDYGVSLDLDKITFSYENTLTHSGKNGYWIFSKRTSTGRDPVIKQIRSESESNYIINEEVLCKF